MIRKGRKKTVLVVLTVELDFDRTPRLLPPHPAPLLCLLLLLLQTKAELRITPRATRSRPQPNPLSLLEPPLSSPLVTATSSLTPSSLPPTTSSNSSATFRSPLLPSSVTELTTLFSICGYFRLSSGRYCNITFSNALDLVMVGIGFRTIPIPNHNHLATTIKISRSQISPPRSPP